MLVIPYSTALSLAQRPYVTWAVVLLCLWIHYQQEQSRDRTSQAASHYCSDMVPAEDDNGLMSDMGFCRYALKALHSQPDPQWLYPKLARRSYLFFMPSDEVLRENESTLRHHYERFSSTAPVNLDARLMYNPASLNPLRIITSSLAHADWWHIAGNLIFFLAFAPALELLVGSAWRFVKVLLLIATATAVSYSLVRIGSNPVPTLGLSGVVMGVIGLSAYLMPKVPIRTAVWFFTFVWRFHIPAWILALWFVGWDAWDLFAGGGRGGVNLVAHVSGGIAGYLIGVYWFRERREEVRDELAEEMEHQRYQRGRFIGQDNRSLSRCNMKRRSEQRDEEQRRRQYAAFLDRLHRLSMKDDESEALLLLLEDYELYRDSAEIYDELYTQMCSWGVSERLLLCLGRLNIMLLLEHGRYARSLVVVEQCLEHSAEFVLAEPRQLNLLLKVALEQRLYLLAYRMVHNAAARYRYGIDRYRSGVIEAKILWNHLGNKREARNIIQGLAVQAGTDLPAEVVQFLRYMEAHAD